MNAKRDLVELVEIITRYFGEFEMEFLKEIEASGITARQLHYLDFIATLENPTFSEVAEMLELSKPSVTAIFRLLAQKGYLKRVDSDSDRRVAHIHLTKKGSDLAKKHDDVHHRIADLIRRSLKKEETRILVALLNKVADAIE